MGRPESAAPASILWGLRLTFRISFPTAVAIASVGFLAGGAEVGAQAVVRASATVMASATIVSPVEVRPVRAFLGRREADRRDAVGGALEIERPIEVASPAPTVIHVEVGPGEGEDGRTVTYTVAVTL